MGYSRNLPCPSPTDRFPQVGRYLEPPAQAVGVLVDRRHLAVTLLAELGHRLHKTMHLQLSAGGEKQALGRPWGSPVGITLLSQGRGHLFAVRRDYVPALEIWRVPSPNLGTQAGSSDHWAQLMAGSGPEPLVSVPALVA